MSKAPGPSAIRGGSPGEPKVTWAAAGARVAPASNIPIAAGIAFLPMLDRLTAISLPCPLAAYYGRSAPRQAKPRRAAGRLSASLGPLAGQDQLFADPGFHRGMAGIGDDDVFGLGPGTGQFVGAADRADHVVAPLHDHCRQVADRADPRHKVALR